MSDIKESLNSIREEFDKALEQVSDSQAAEQLRVSFLGKKGQLTQVLKGMGGLTAEERPVIGKIANDVRSHMESRLEEIVARIKEEEKSHKLRREVIDVTIPSDWKGAGSRHPLNMAINEICDIFLGLGYSIAEGPEVEYDKYNFELLRIPEGHPALFQVRRLQGDEQGTGDRLQKEAHRRRLCGPERQFHAGKPEQPVPVYGLDGSEREKPKNPAKNLLPRKQGTDQKRIPETA